MRTVLAAALLSLLASPAFADAPSAAIRVFASGPPAVFLDGVKLASIDALPLPKRVPAVSHGRCGASGCTLIITH